MNNNILQYIPTRPLKVPEPVNVLDRADGVMHRALADYMVEILDAQTVSDALSIADRLARLMAYLEAHHSSALNRADTLTNTRH